MFTSEQLVSPDFDEEAYLRFVLHASGSSTATERARIVACMESVKESIHGILAENSDTLVEQVKATHKAQRDVSLIAQSASSLGKATGRLRLMIEGPYMAVKDKVRELENTRAALTVLRDVQRFIALTTRLQDPVVADDVIRAARTLREVEELLNKSDASSCSGRVNSKVGNSINVRGVTVVESRMGIVEKVSTTVRGKINTMLGMQELLQSSAQRQESSSNSRGFSFPVGSAPGLSKTVVDVGTALQCANILGTLSRTVQAATTEHKREAMKYIMRELDHKTIAEHVQHASGGGSGGGGGNTATMQEVLLSRIQSTLYVTVQHTQCVLLLWCILLGKQDPTTHTPFLASIDSPMQLLAEYWSAVSDKLRERLTSLQRSGSLQGALTSAYPQYHALLGSFLYSSGGIRAVTGGLSEVSVSAAAASGCGDAGGFSTLAVLNVRQCGMGDYLDLIQRVEQELQRAGSLTMRSGATPSPSADAASAAERLASGWLAEASGALQQRFSAQLMDHHRERVGAVLAKLTTISPSSAALGGQTAAPVVTSSAVPSAAYDSRRSQVPLYANALDVGTYTKLALQDAHAYRHDPHTLDIVLDCVLQCAQQQLYSKMRENLTRCPLPPLPSITAQVTRTQLLHVCVANACTTLVQDLTAILSLLPSETLIGAATDSADRAALQAQEEMMMKDVEKFSGSRRQRLRAFIQACRTTSEMSSRPFLDSAVVTLLPAITQCVEAATTFTPGKPKAGLQESAAVLQLQAQLGHFVTHCYCLLSPATSRWHDHSRYVADAMVTRLLVQVAAVSGGEGDAGLPLRALLRHCLEAVSTVLFAFVRSIQANGVGRSTLLLKGSVKQVEDFYSLLDSRDSGESPEQLQQQLTSTLRSLYPPLAKLLLLQQLALESRLGGGGSATPLLTPASTMQVKGQVLVEVVEDGLLEACESPKPDVSTPAVGSTQPRQRLPEAEQAIQTCFDKSTEGGVSPTSSLYVSVWHALFAQQQQYP